MPRKLALLFDLDGTLVDSVGDLTAAINGLLTEHGRAPLTVDEVRPMVGDGVGVLVQRALAARPGPEIDLDTAVARYVALYEASPSANTLVYPGVVEALEVLDAQGYSLIVCTNKPERLTHAVLKALGLDRYFARVYGGDSLPWRKPDPLVIHTILAELRVTPPRALFIGDSEVDAACAEAAGVPFALMTYGYHRVPIAEIPRMATLDSFGELLLLLTDT
jgi:phosphoglycolate phosphatase